MNSKTTLIALALACATVAAHAQPKAQKVFRCGPDGRIYSQTPCKDGAAVDVADPRSGDQQRAAAQASQRQQAQNDKDARERERRDTAAVKQSGAAHIPYLAASQAAAASAPKAKPRARRAAGSKPAS